MHCASLAEPVRQLGTSSKGFLVDSNRPEADLRGFGLPKMVVKCTVQTFFSWLIGKRGSFLRFAVPDRRLPGAQWHYQWWDRKEVGDFHGLGGL